MLKIKLLAWLKKWGFSVGALALLGFPSLAAASEGERAPRFARLLHEQLTPGAIEAEIRSASAGD